MEEKFHTITTRQEMEQLFQKVPSGTVVGLRSVFRKNTNMSMDGAGQSHFCFMEEPKRLLALAVCLDGENVYCLETGEKLPEQEIL